MKNKIESKKRKLLALVVDDNPDIIAASKVYFEGHGLKAIGATSVQEALRHVKTTPSLDLVITDVHLSLDPESADTGGVTLAKEIRKLRSDLPVLAYTGQKDPDFSAQVDWGVFNEPLSKGGGFEEIERNLATCLEYARGYQRKRISTAKDELRRLQEKYRIPNYEVETLRSFLPGSRASAGRENSDPSEQAKTDEISNADELLRRFGYELQFVEAGAKVGDEQTGMALAQTPIPVWIKKEGKLFVAELYGHPSIYADGERRRDAIESLAKLMCGYHKDLLEARDQELGPEMLNLKGYLIQLFGKSQCN